MSFKGLGLEGVRDGFELPGSTPHYPPSIYFSINYMSLTIEPKLKAEEEPTLVKCQEKLDIIAKRDIDEIQLDIAEIKVDSVFSSPYLCQKTKTYDIVENHTTELKFNDSDKNKQDKLTITLSQTLKKGDSICIIINYSAGYDAEKGLVKSPRSGFHFIRPDNYYKTKPYQAWTQGEATESRYWFPCLDDPQVKFPRELHVIVPEEYTVIANGISECKEEKNKGSENVDNIKKIEWIWKESSPIQTYVTSVVIGNFKMKEEIYGKQTDRHIRLLYYWRENIERKGYDPKFTFGQTQELMKFFESYLQTNYPYKKYSQVTVEDFDYGGMENTSCTTLPSDLFHDKDALPNYTWDDEVIRHELVHQWFGDLVTCRDWQHIWLNEGFATYCEALYLDQEYINNAEKDSSSRDDFYHYMLTNITPTYFTGSVEYKRPIVTNTYKHPDDLLDSHSYEKGACVFHMLRNYIGENNFRESLRIYLDRHKNITAETEDLRKVLEEVSGLSLQQFFEQWLYRAGHPILNIEFVIEKDGEKELLKIKIKQIEKADAQDSIEELAKDEGSEKLIDEKEFFVFPLDIKLCFSDFAGIEPTKTFSFEVLKRENEFTIDLTEKGIKKLHYISIDPELKILREINSIKFEDKVDSIKHTIS
jgi:aminopeptidase N